MAPGIDFGSVPLKNVAPLAVRDEAPNQDHTVILIVGIVIIIVLVLGAAIALLVRHLRKRAAAKRKAERGAAFLNVRGLVREDDQKRCVRRPALALPLIVRRVLATVSRCRAASSRASR